MNKYGIEIVRGRYKVIETATNRYRGIYDDEFKAADRIDELEFMDELKIRIRKDHPLPEDKIMTNEEKAAEYDRIMAERDKL